MHEGDAQSQVLVSSEDILSKNFQLNVEICVQVLFDFYKLII